MQAGWTRQWLRNVTPSKALSSGNFPQILGSFLEFIHLLPLSCAGELDEAVARGGHAAEVALLRALSRLASSASEAQVLWLLQRAQLMLATMHQRAACGKT